MIINTVKSLWQRTNLFSKLSFTIFVMVVYRIGTFMPVIGINVSMLKEYIQSSSIASGIFGFIDLFSAGNLSQCTLFALGIGPSITASIIMQLAGFSFPVIQALSKEGEYGREIINRYTRYLTLALSFVYSIGLAIYFQSIPGIVFHPGFGFITLFTISLASGCMFVMWLGDQIKVLGVGNGSSMIIFAGIVARFPSYFVKTIEAIKVGSMSTFVALIILIIFCLITACIVYLEQADRKIMVSYARRVVGNKMFGGQSSYIPFKINTVGVMPVIFASSFLNFPLFILKLLSKIAFFAWLGDVFNYKGPIYNVLLFGLIIFFTYIYTALIFDPQELSDSLKKNGGFIPGVRPGKQTADFFDYVLVRIGFFGALYLGILAVLPNVVPVLIPSIPFELGGTSLLIVVGVALDFITQIRSYMLEYKYDSFLPSTRMK
jgi:preprotein translocase subunit SecY